MDLSTLIITGLLILRDQIVFVDVFAMIVVFTGISLLLIREKKKKKIRV
jgi:hypothetical protein